MSDSLLVGCLSGSLMLLFVCSGPCFGRVSTLTVRKSAFDVKRNSYSSERSGRLRKLVVCLFVFFLLLFI